MMHMGELIVRIRESQNFSQSALAGAVGVSQPQMSALEKRASWDLALFERAVKKLGYEVELTVIGFDSAAALPVSRYARPGHASDCNCLVCRLGRGEKVPAESEKKSAERTKKVGS